MASGRPPWASARRSDHVFFFRVQVSPPHQSARRHGIIYRAALTKVDPQLTPRVGVWKGLVGFGVCYEIPGWGSLSNLLFQERSEEPGGASQTSENFEPCWRHGRRIGLGHEVA